MRAKLLNYFVLYYVWYVFVLTWRVFVLYCGLMLESLCATFDVRSSQLYCIVADSIH